MAIAQQKGEKPRRYLAAKTPKAKPQANGAKPQAEGKSAPPITKETNIMELVHNYPEAVPVLIEAGLHCIGCQLSVFDTIEQGCAIHGIEGENVDKLVKEMNERVKNFRK